MASDYSPNDEDLFLLESAENGTRTIQSDRVVNPYSGRELDEKFNESSQGIEELNGQITEIIGELAKKVNTDDMIPYIHYVASEGTTPPIGTTYSLADRVPNSYSYVNLEWYGDKPSDLTGTAWIFTIIPKSDSSFGMQFCLKHQNKSLYIRTKTKQADNTYIWGEWSTFSDKSLSVEGGLADAKAVGDALANAISRLATIEFSMDQMFENYVMRYTDAPYSTIEKNSDPKFVVDCPVYSTKALVLTSCLGHSSSTQGSRAQLGLLATGEIVVRTSSYGTSDWLPWSDWSPIGTSNNIKDGAITEPKLATNLLTPYLHYVAAESTAPPEGTTYSLADRTPNSYSYVNLDRYGDKPSDLTGTAWIFTIIPKSDSSFGMQFCLKHQDHSLRIRTKTKQADNTYIWGNWSTFSDASLSIEGAFADAKAVGDALMKKVGLADMLPYLHYEGLTAPPEGTTYSLADRTPNSYSYVTPSFFEDSPRDPRIANAAWIFTIIPRSSSNFGMQIWLESSTNACFKRTKSTTGWKEWIRIDDAYATDSTYFAFGDSLVAGQIGRWTGPTHHSNRGYPDTTAAMLHMKLNNQAVGGQGLIKDWALIIDTINALNMSSARLITVGWYGNDGNVYKKPGLAMGSYTDVTEVDVTDADAVKALVTYTYDEEEGALVPSGFGTTVMGYYFTIMKLLQTKCPKSNVVLVTGYGHSGGDRTAQLGPTFKEQFTKVRYFGSGPSHTYKEMFDELEKMANLHGWGCVNQSKGCAFNEFNAPYLFGDHAHPTDDGYALYGNNLAPRIAQFYANRKLITKDLL